jgi:hypothetical protein
LRCWSSTRPSCGTAFTARRIGVSCAACEMGHARVGLRCAEIVKINSMHWACAGAVFFPNIPQSLTTFIRCVCDVKYVYVRILNGAKRNTEGRKRQEKFRPHTEHHLKNNAKREG